MRSARTEQDLASPSIGVTTDQRSRIKSGPLPIQDRSFSAILAACSGINIALTAFFESAAVALQAKPTFQVYDHRIPSGSLSSSRRAGLRASLRLARPIKEGELGRLRPRLAKSSTWPMPMDKDTWPLNQPMQWERIFLTDRLAAVAYCVCFQLAAAVVPKSKIRN